MSATGTPRRSCDGRNERDLFEDVKCSIGCLNISDYKAGYWRIRAIRTLYEMDITSYPLRALEDMVEYLLDVRIHFCDHEQARCYFRRQVVPAESVRFGGK